MRSEGKHTPTPFTVTENTMQNGISQGSGFCIWSGGKGFTAVALLFNGQASQEDADFIVKACNAYDGMLEALKRIMAAHHECLLVGRKCNEKDQLCIPCVTRFAIAKAEAKSEPR